MTYILIFGFCYCVTLALLVADFKVNNIHRPLFSNNFLLLAMAAFFYGSIAGAFLSGFYWWVWSS